MKSIGSQKRARESKSGRNMSGSELPLIRNMGQMREVELENERIMKKLNEIGRRKSQFIKQSRVEKNYYTINIRSTAATRKHKFQLIQQENDMMVERILEKRSASKSLLSELSRVDSQSSLKKSRKRQKRNSSMALPELKSSKPEVPNMEDDLAHFWF